MAEKRSLVWKYFSVVESNGKKKAKCNLCHLEVSYSGGSTGTMSNHLKHIHKSINVNVASSQPKMAQSRITDFKKNTSFEHAEAKMAENNRDTCSNVRA